MHNARTQQALDIVVHLCRTAGHPLTTRLRETGHGDRYDLLPAFRLPDLALTPADLIGALEALEEEGLVTRSETVHTYDGTEYLIVWSPVEP